MIEKDISIAQAWIGEIQCDIDTKYHVENPILIINDNPQNLDVIIQWCHSVLCQNRWVLYKHLDNNVFELKSFYPNSPDEACKKTISNFFEIWGPAQNNNVFYRIGKTIYTRKQVEKEMLYSLKAGSSEIVIDMEKEGEPDPNPKKHRIIISPVFQENEMYHRITSGLLNLEYKD